MPDTRLPTDRGVALAAIREALGPAGIIDAPDELAPYCRSWRDDIHGRVPLVARPASTDEVARVVALCAEGGIAIVPQGGNTGLTGAGQPHDDASEIILSLSRMNQIRAVDPLNDTMTVEAGCVLQTIQEAALAVDRLFPLSLAAEGSCQIGGNLSTNAGGIHVVRYGSAKGLVLGLEVVLADGRVWHGLKGLRKDNAGYDLKQLFLGTEGTMGVITAAVLKLFPRPTDRATAFLAVEDPAAALTMLARAKAAFGEAVTAFELIQRRGVELAAAKLDGVSDPLEGPHPWYVLMELTGQSAPGTLDQGLETYLADAFEAGVVTDATIAMSDAHADRLWHMREGLAEAQNTDGVSIKHDVSVPVSSIPEFLARANEALLEAYPTIRLLAFGHVGDGNLHYNPAQPLDWEADAYRAERLRINRIVHDIVVDLGGSISAEHGIGILRKAELAHYADPVALDLMAKVKSALDPHDLLNPGKVFDPSSS
ncbi:MAG: FAD-binding oxidoreductase [Pseudomonadota bacterium]